MAIIKHTESKGGVQGQGLFKSLATRAITVISHLISPDCSTSEHEHSMSIVNVTVTLNKNIVCLVHTSKHCSKNFIGKFSLLLLIITMENYTISLCHVTFFILQE